MFYSFLFFSSHIFLFFSYYILPLLIILCFYLTVCCIQACILNILWANFIHKRQNYYYIEKTPRNVPVWQKSAKYTTAYIVQKSNCRWHCERSCQIRLGLNKEKSIHTLPLQYLHLLSLHLYPSLSKPSVLSPWSVCLLKHKE